MVKRAASGIFSVALLFLSCLRLPAKQLADYRLGQTVEKDIFAPKRLIVIDTAATQALREKAVQAVPVFFGYDSNAVTQVEAGFESAFDNARRQFLDAMERAFRQRTLTRPMASSPAFDRFLDSYRKEHGDFPLKPVLAWRWACGESDEAIRADARRALHEAMSYYIIPDAAPPDLALREEVRILPSPTSDFPPNLETALRAGRLIRRSNLFTLTSARKELMAGFQPEERRWSEYLATFVKANCVLEAALTRQLRAERTGAVWVADCYEAGQRIAGRGQVIDAKTMAAIAQLDQKLALNQTPRQFAGGQAKVPSWNNWKVWLAASLLALGMVGWRLARRNHQRALLPAKAGAGPTAAMVVSCPSCSEPVVIPPAGVQAARAAVSAGLVTQLAHLLTDKLVQKLISQRRGLLDTQQKAAQEVAELEARLQKIHAPLQDRLAIYEKRINELEKELATKSDETRILIEAKISLVRKQAETERAQFQLARN
jgi:hypothetical protein